MADEYIKRMDLYKKVKNKDNIDKTDFEFMILEEPAADVEPVNRWISVEERLPDIKKIIDGDTYFAHVLVLTDDEDYSYRIAYYDDEVKMWGCPGGLVLGANVTHWQPLPKLPKGYGERSGS